LIVTNLNAFGKEPEIAAIWADSSFTNIPSVLEDQLEMNGLPAFLKNSALIVAKIVAMTSMRSARLAQSPATAAAL
jgi:hypothetical protein